MVIAGLVGGVALTRKVIDERDKKRREKQGDLVVGDSDLARRAFTQKERSAPTTQTQRRNSVSGASQGADTPARPDHPNDCNLNVTDADMPNDAHLSSPTEGEAHANNIHDARHTSEVNVSSPVWSEHGVLGVVSPIDEPSTAGGAQSLRPQQQRVQGFAIPQPFSPLAELSGSSSKEDDAMSPSIYSRDTDANTLAENASMSSQSTQSFEKHPISLRVKSNDSNIKFGFPYHSALFDLRVHPHEWERFTKQIVNSVKLEMGDHAKMWTAATATALTGHFGTSVYVGRSLDRSFREKRIKSGLEDMSEGSLGDVLKSWNDTYFRQQGLFVHLELSESAMKHPSQKSTTFRMPALGYSSKEDRERKRDERKYVIVVTKLDEQGEPTEAMRDFAAAEGEQDVSLTTEQQQIEGAQTRQIRPDSSSDTPTVAVAEMPETTHPSYLIPEMPGEQGRVPSELPAEVSLGYSPEKLLEPAAELDGENVMSRSPMDTPTGKTSDVHRTASYMDGLSSSEAKWVR